MIRAIPKDYLNDARTYISFKSISTDPAFLPEIKKTVSWLSVYLKEGGAMVKIFEGVHSNPVVFGHFFVDTKLPTVLVYGHYDVQPAEKSDGWSTKDPFVIEEKRGKLFGRGVVDNKGQNLIHLYTVRTLFRARALRYNVKFLLEGNEESGNPDLAGVLAKNRKDFIADYVIVSDGEIVGRTPVLEAALRGGGNIRVIYTTGKNNLHSGLFGGAVPSAPLELARVLTSLKDKNNTVLIPGFYAGVKVPSRAIRKNSERIGSAKEAAALAGVKQLITMNHLDFYTQTGLMPALEISGVLGGYVGEGFANIVPGKAEARINVRTVAPQKTNRVMKLVRDYLVKQAPPYASVQIHVEGHGDPIKLDDDAPAAREIAALLKKIYGKTPIKKYVGGSIPILGDFQRILKTKVLSVSLGNDDCNMHGVDENYTIDLLQKGLRFSERFFSGKK